MTQNNGKGPRPAGKGRNDRNEGGGRGGRGGGAPGGRRDDGRRPSGAGPGRDEGARPRGGRGLDRNEAADALAWMFVSTQGCAELTVPTTHLPAPWRRIPDSPFFKPGLYLRGPGALSQVAREFVFENAVLIAAWEDPDFAWPSSHGPVRVGQHALFLIPSGNAEGPPWLPIWAALRGDASDHVDGIFSGWPDPDRPTRLAIELSLDKDRVTARHTRPVQDTDGTPALIEALRWLADHTSDTSVGASALRAALVEGGHGLQRLGLALGWDERSHAHRLLQDVVSPLAPSIAPLLLTLVELHRVADEATQRSLFRDLVRMIGDMHRPDRRPHVTRADYAIVATWMHGLFGLRPDRESAQPARTLLLASRLSRAFWNHPETLDHPDAPIPTIPLSPGDLARAQNDLAAPRFEESDLEVLIRGMSIAEAAQELRSPRLEHLDALRRGWEALCGYPVAGRAFAGRHDYLLSLASFRRIDGRDGEIGPHHLIVEVPSVASSRAYGRLVGNGSESAAGLVRLLAASTSAVARNVAEGLDAPLDALQDRIDEFASQRCTPVRLNATGALIERLVAASETGKLEVTRPLPAPEAPDESSVRSHYLYWRQYCRSLIRSQGDGYLAFLSHWLPQADALPVKLQREVLALARTWLRLDPSHPSQADTIRACVTSQLARLDGSEGAWDTFRGEHAELLFGLAAELAPEDAVAALQRLAESPDWGLRDAGRLLETLRRNGAAETLLTGGFFRTLHRALAAGTGPHAVLGRAEWLRIALQRARRSGAVQWLLDGRRNAAFLATRAFADFFADDAPRAIDRPDDTLVRLLEVALAHAPEELEEELASAVTRATQWTPEAAAAALRDAGRTHAAATVLVRNRAGSREDAVATARAALRDCRDGRSLLRAAEAVSALRTLWLDLDDDLAADVASVFADWRPTHRLGDGAQQGLDAWRLLHASDRQQPDPAFVEVAARLAIHARYAPSAQTFVQESLVRSLVDALAPAFDADGSFTIELSAPALTLWKRITKESRHDPRVTPARLVRECLPEAASTLLADRFAEAAAHGRLDGFVARLDELVALEGTGDAASAAGSADDETDDGPSNSHEDGMEDVTASADADSEDAMDANAPESADASDTSEASDDAKDNAPRGRGKRGPAGTMVDATLAISFAARALRPLAEAARDEEGISTPVLRSLTTRDAAGYAMGTHLAGAASSAMKAAGGRLQGDRALRRGGSLRVDLSLMRWQVLLATLASGLHQEGLRPELSIDDRRLSFVLRAIASESALEDTDEDETQEGSPSGRDEAADEPEADDVEPSVDAPLARMSRLAARIRGTSHADGTLLGSRVEELALPLLAAGIPLLEVKAPQNADLLRLDPRGGRSGGGARSGGGRSGGRRRAS